MQDLPYYLPGGGGKRKYLEGLIPIVILILIALVLLGKTTTMLCGIPFLGGLFCGAPTIRIAVIGNFLGEGVNEATYLTAPKLKEVLDGYLGSTYNIYYAQFDPELLTYAKDALLRNYDITILVGERAFTRPVKDAVGWYVDNGGKLIVIGDAAVRDPDDLLFVGWGGGMFNTFPVRLAYDADIDEPIVISNPTLNLFDIDHTIVKGYQPKLNLSEVACTEVSVLDVQPTGGGVIAILSSGTKDVPGIVESGGTLLGGRVIYFGFDPGCTPNLWISTVGYLTGKIPT